MAYKLIGKKIKIGICVDHAIEEHVDRSGRVNFWGFLVVKRLILEYGCLGRVDMELRIKGHADRPEMGWL